ncbi:hypothetical protein EJ08DRAFT_658617 [Tothia fuscella]|uniref:Uncharacterized protein n=1 Tax=Tothia fuscella TaxID=1048955 RepID=A0A9P4U0P3_9PEZI|nr:hypothetical protein EJ08DRAFT_658617 [Tothia fuscella]
MYPEPKTHLSGNFDVESAPGTSLTNSIHPIVLRKNWRINEYTKEQGELFFEVTRPARQLATRFLRTPKLQGWWLHTMTSHKLMDDATGVTILAKDISGSANVRRERAKHALVRSTFGITMKIASAKQEKDHLVKRAAWGLTTRVKDTEHDPMGELAFRHKAIHVSITRRVLDYVIEEYEQAPQHMQQLFQIQLAYLIVHELAHAIYIHHHPIFRSEINKESLHSLHEILPEMGYSWDSWLLGTPHLRTQFHKLGKDLKWDLKLLAPQRDPQDGSMKLYRPEKSEHGPSDPVKAYGGDYNIRRMLQLLEEDSWQEIELVGLEWFRHGGLLVPSDMVSYWALKQEIDHRSNPGSSSESQDVVSDKADTQEPKELHRAPDACLGFDWSTASARTLRKHFRAFKKHIHAVYGVDPDKYTQNVVTHEDLMKPNYDGSCGGCEICKRVRSYMILCHECKKPTYCGVVCRIVARRRRSSKEMANETFCNICHSTQQAARVERSSNEHEAGGFEGDQIMSLTQESVFREQ